LRQKQGQGEGQREGEGEPKEVSSESKEVTFEEQTCKNLNIFRFK